MNEPASRTCPRCGLATYHPVDVAEGFCGRCNAWTDRGQRRRGGIEPSLTVRAERLEQSVTPRPRDVNWLTMCATVLLALLCGLVWAPDLLGGRGNYVFPVLLFAFSTTLAAIPVWRRLRGRRSLLAAAAVLREWDQHGEGYAPADPGEFDRQVGAFLISEAVVRRDRWWLKVAQDVHDHPIHR